MQLKHYFINLCPHSNLFVFLRLCRKLTVMKFFTEKGNKLSSGKPFQTNLITLYLADIFVSGCFSVTLSTCLCVFVDTF